MYESAGYEVFRGHIFHIAGAPTVVEARQHLVSVPDGALVTGEDGTIVWVGSFATLPAAFARLPARLTLP